MASRKDVKPKPPCSKPEQRHSPIRRQFNQAFCDPEGNFLIGKFLAIWAQIAVLAHMNRFFEELISKPETLLVILSFLIAPHVITRLATMKLGGTK